MERRRTESDVDRARREVDEQRARLAQVDAERMAAEAELDSMQTRVGVEALDNPASAGQAVRSLQELRDRIFIAGKAIEAQEPRVRAAEVAYLEAEAAALEQRATVARRALEQHTARTSELLGLLESHEGRFVPEHLLIVERTRGVAGGDVSWAIPKSQMLAAELEAAERPVRILRALAAGEDPQERVEFYPACVASEDAVVKAPAYLRSLTAQGDAVRAIEESTIPGLERQVAILEQERQKAIEDGRREELSTTDGHRRPTIADRMLAARRRLDEAQTRLRELSGAVEADVDA